MSLLTPEVEFVDRATESIRYLEHGWPTDLCRWHSHEEYELHLIVATQGKAFVGDYIGPFRPGALFLTGPNLPHNWVTDEIGKAQAVPLRDMLVQFDRASLEHLKAAFPEFRALDHMLARSAGGVEFVDFDLSTAHTLFAAVRDAKGADRILKFLNLLLTVNAHPQQKRLSDHNVAFPNFQANRTRIADVVDHITTHFAEDLSLEQAATMAHMSTAAFSRNFQKRTGTRFTEFLTKVRIGQACSMLQATDEKIATICHEVGFRNLANFNRHFLKVKGMTPSAFRDVTRAELLPQRPNAND
ncbi:AraC family transcriptional regulator [Jannaschia pagri]|uniref:AraC family transcriptional regulator n=1 Tax=Jannaschia pagri TaxID=2829797 RepID=A0ABQ4NIP7_9RHOB|nr:MULTISPECIES: AraC family transcriptional regulator [unclassified Jannaschia]GIT89630.1 AraC family transcriptional regulator [Jannaschia sp. AI_61]GIT94262.1 AraC family transcriptional regulator [Jannaschia sp. AI_62]